MELKDKKLIGWTKWEGGECPVPDGYLTELMFENDGTTTIIDNPEKLIWKKRENRPELEDIIAYKQLQFGTCQNGDPIVLGGEYVIRGRVAKFIDYQAEHPSNPLLIAYGSNTHTAFERDFEKLYKKEPAPEIIEAHGCKYKKID